MDLDHRIMRILYGKRVFRRGVLLYRKIRYRKGHGVHSPFVFNLITKVIDERASFYCLRDIQSTRDAMSRLEQTFPIAGPDKAGTARLLPAHKIVRQNAVKPKSGTLLMRIVNYFRPRTILQIGCSAGFSSLYLSAYDSGIPVVVLERDPGLSALSRLVFEMHKTRNIELREGPYTETLPGLLSGNDGVDFIYLDFGNTPATNRFAFEQCLPFFYEKSVLVMGGIKTSGEKKKFWNEICSCPEVSVTVDVYEFGIAFFNKKLHKRNYIVSF